MEIKVKGKFYTEEELQEIISAYEKEQDKKLKTCYKCKEKFEKNTHHNLVKLNLQSPIEMRSGNTQGVIAVGYSSTPLITGVKIMSTHGDGREFDLCDNCIADFLDWIGYLSEYVTIKGIN